MRFLTVMFASHEEFMSHFSNEYPNGALFCPTKAVESLNTKVIVDLSIPLLRQPARLCGQVISHSSGKGMWVHFDEKSKACVHHLECLQDLESSQKVSRAHSRYPASLAVRCSIDEDDPKNEELEVLQGKIVDLSQGGAFVSGESIPMIGTRVSLNIGPFARGRRNCTVDGQVVWVGTIDEQDGFGVRFDRRRKSGTKFLRTLLRKSSERGELHLD